MVILILCLPYLNFYNKEIADYEGKIKSFHPNYVIIDNAIVYTGDLIIDSIIKVEGKIEELTVNNSFYAFNFNQYLNQRGVYYQIKNPTITVLKEGNSVLAKVQKRILGFTHSNSYLYKILLNINTDEEVLINSGFCFIGFIRILELLLNKIFYKKQSKLLKLFILSIFTLIYNFKINILRLFIYNCLSLLKLNKQDQVGIFIIIYLVIFPYEIYSIGFWLILIYYSKNILHLSYSYTIFLVSIIQSLFLNYLNILGNILYKYLIYVYGFLYLLAIFILITNFNLTVFLGFIDSLLRYINSFKLYGNVLGIGSVLLLLIKDKYKIYGLIFLLYFSLIHPFAEITFINVGQGDAILIRQPFNRGNYLIDTGKASSYKYLDSYLKAKGIKKISYLFISHYDEDHCGNLENLRNDYVIKNIIDKHFEVINDGIIIYDLNDSLYDNDNDNSLVNLLEINNLRILLMGDASKQVESDLIEKFEFNDIDILKAGHHGSNTSSSKTFIKSIKPKLTVFSAGVNNRYAHPSNEVLNLFDNEGLAYLSTNTSGDITIFIFYNFKFFYTSDGKIGII